MHTTHALDLTYEAPPAATASAVVLRTDFRSGDERWSAIGGGETVGDAILFARESLPGGRDWELARFAPLSANSRPRKQLTFGDADAMESARGADRRSGAPAPRR